MKKGDELQKKVFRVVQKKIESDIYQLRIFCVRTLAIGGYRRLLSRQF